MSGIPLERLGRLLMDGFGITAHAIEPAEPGMSGASVFRVETNAGAQLALKCWPSGTQPQRVAEVHRVVQRAIDGGCRFVPRPMPSRGENASRTFVVQASRVWELSQWLPGRPVTSDMSPERIARGAAAIGQFHQAVRPLLQRTEIPRAVQDRCSRVAEVSSVLERDLPHTKDVLCPAHEDRSAALSRIRLPPSTRGADFPHVAELATRSVLESWPTVASTVRLLLTPHLARQRSCQYVVRDLRRSHLLFEGDGITGLIDFDAVRVDTPATDLARWTVDLLGTGPQANATEAVLEPGSTPMADEAAAIWDTVLAGYRLQAPFSEQEERLARRLMYASSWISLANWVIWTKIQPRSFPVRYLAIHNRMAELLMSTARISADFASG